MLDTLRSCPRNMELLFLGTEINENKGWKWIQESSVLKTELKETQSDKIKELYSDLILNSLTRRGDLSMISGSSNYFDFRRIP